MDRLRSSHDIALQWHSFELRPVGSPPISAEYRARIEAGRPRFVAQAREQFGLEIKTGPFGINSRPALIGAKIAEAQGVGNAYHDAAFRAYWLEGQDLSAPATLSAIAAKLGLDEATFLAQLAEPDYETAVTADIEQAFQYGLNSVPALVFGNKYLVVGAQPVETLANVVDQLMAENGETQPLDPSNEENV